MTTITERKAKRSLYGPSRPVVLPTPETFDNPDDIDNAAMAIPHAVIPQPSTVHYSVVLSASGVDDRSGYSWETDIRDIELLCERVGLPHDTTEPNDSEYAYLLAEDGHEERHYVEATDREIDDSDDVLFTPRRGYIVDERTRSQWWGIRDVTASGILDAEQMAELASFCSPTDTETLGTLGGPLGECIVPDIEFIAESPILIDSIRVTPFCPDWPDDKYISEETWKALKAATIARFE